MKEREQNVKILFVGESNLSFFAIKRQICLNGFSLMGQDCQWDWLELLGRGRGLETLNM